MVMTIKKEEMIALFGTENETEIKDSKTKTEKQQRIKAAAKPSIVKMSSDECKALCKSVGLEYLEGYEKRVIEHVISDETSDRVGDIMRAKGVDIENYVKNPVILFVHNGRTFPIGKSLKVWSSGKKVLSWGLFFDDRVDKFGVSDNAFRYIKSGAMPAVSIGFIPKIVNYPATDEERKRLGLGKYGAEYKEWELTEYSACPVPCNPNALRRVLDEETLTGSNIKFLVENKMVPEEMKNEIDTLLQKNETEELKSIILEMGEFSKTFKDFSDFKELLNEAKALVEGLNETLKTLTQKPSDTEEVADSGKCEDDINNLYSKVFLNEINI